MKKTIRFVGLTLMAVFNFVFLACSKDEAEDNPNDPPKNYYNVELSDIESHGSMLNVFQFEEVNHRQRSDNEEYYLYYFHDPGAKKIGCRNRVLVIRGKVNNFQTSFEYTFKDSKVNVEYEDGNKETLVLNKSVQRALRAGDYLYINNVPYKRLNSYNETY